MVAAFFSLSLVIQNSCSSKHWTTGFHNIRLRFTIHLNITHVHTQPLKLLSRGTPLIHYYDSNYHHLPLNHPHALIWTDHQGMLGGFK